MKIQLFTLGLNLENQDSVTPVITYNENLFEVTDRETLTNVLSEEDLRVLTEIGVKIVHKIKGFE